ncbi:hypothetical protein SSX86_015820 [Deinandra increscens subsp. villosa]|uniref:Uncharacterized protein n=1 Tax=Deinandra increscens subsp. villosa TaxID=3103831 RepID=A0AAP0GV22_9ASTR
MGSLHEGENSPSLRHAEIIKQIVHPSFASQALIRSFERSFSGFAAYLSEEEKEKLTKISGIISVFPCRKSHLQTTRSWNFMGLSTTVERRPSTESDIIIGVIDTGIWPESESFSDEGFGPIPAKWKGGCYGGKDFSCNRKIIGARTFNIKSTEMEPSARDKDGHGTHVASIIAGNHIIDANYYGIAQGIARGGVPSARLAIYKTCDPDCEDIDLLSAFDRAIADGVDIISISIGHKQSPVELTSDPIAIGAFHALEMGILTVHSAGNDGPSLYSVISYAPWILTVGASATDRRIADRLVLANNSTLVGNAINAFPSSSETLPLVYGKEVMTSNCSEMDARNCQITCINSSLIENKVVLCDQNPYFMLTALKISGAVGCIYPESIGDNFSGVMPFPAISLTRNDFTLVKAYKGSAGEPQVQILKSEAINNPGAPFIASFSARGPSIFIPDIIKPDVIAPGVEILASFSPIGSPSGYQGDKSSVNFNIISGTSMACPHVAAAAAFVKSFHPEWSPSAIKSALMTTGQEFNASLYPEAEFAYGSGHINPIKAITPGLVYETNFEDYSKIWCNISRTLGSDNPTSASCPVEMTPKDLNYPSMTTQQDMTNDFVVLFSRTVTNVGRANSTYVASIESSHSKLHMSVEPNSLQFTALNQKMTFTVSVTGKRMKTPRIERMSLLWSDGVHRVRSPVVIYTMETSSGERTPTPSRRSHIISVASFIIMILLLISVVILMIKFVFVLIQG